MQSTKRTTECTCAPRNGKAQTQHPLPANERQSLREAILKATQAHYDKNHLNSARDFLLLLDHCLAHTPETLQTLGNLCFLLGDYRSAATSFRRALADQPNHGGLWVSLALTCQRLNDQAGLEDGLNHALALEPDNLDALKLRADQHHSQGRFAEAVAVYETLLNRHPSRIEVLLSLAKCLFKLGDRDATESALEQVLRIDPANEVARENLAVLHAPIDSAPTSSGQTPGAHRFDSMPTRPPSASTPWCPERASANHNAGDFPEVYNFNPSEPRPRSSAHHAAPTCPQSISVENGLTLEIGDHSYIHDSKIRNPSGAKSRVTIGKFCSIATELTVIGYDHHSEWATTYPFLDDALRAEWPGTAGIPYPDGPEHGSNKNRGDIQIGNDVWIGYGVKLFKGVTIGNGAVIGACSLVNKSVEPYTVVAGIPARPIRKRFSDQEITFLEEIQWWNWAPEQINRYMPYLCSSKLAELQQLLEQEPLNSHARTIAASQNVPAEPGPDGTRPSNPAAPVALSGQELRDTVKRFLEEGHEFFAEVEPPQLSEQQLRNSRVLPSRHHILALMPKGGICAEVGTQTGEFAKQILSVMQPAKLHVFDIDLRPFDHAHFQPAVQKGLVELHEGDSATMLAAMPDRHFDFIYIDGDHSYEGVVRDLEQAHRAIKDDGWIVCNDYTLFSPLERIKYGVYRAVNEFCLRKGFEIVYLGLHNWSYHDVALRKARGSSLSDTATQRDVVRPLQEPASTSEDKIPPATSAVVEVRTTAPESSPASETKIRKLAQYVGDDWKQQPYYDDAEQYMEKQWRETIWPYLKGSDFSCVLDLAAGHGRNSEKLKEFASQIVVVDINQENISFCKQRFSGDPRFTFIRNDGCSLATIGTGSISLVYCFDAMVHFDSDVVRAYLREFQRVLRPGGRGFCHHSNYTSNPGGDVHQNPGWRNFMSEALFAHYCVKEGLQVLQSRAIDWTGPGSDCITLFKKP